jgi:hypothetical protein
MPDDHDLEEPEPDRDERVAAVLAVEPLDELTRRRLVTTAVRSGTTARRSRALLVAAALVGLLVVGAGVVVALRNDDRTAPSAARDKLAPADRGGVSARASTARDLGSFGNLEQSSELERLRRATGTLAENAPLPAAGSSRSDASAASSAPVDGRGRVDALVARLGALACAQDLPPGTVTGLATGDYAGKDAIVVATRGVDGTLALDAVVARPCSVHRLGRVS